MEPFDNVGAFVPGPRAELGPLGDGPLSAQTFAVKDLFDVAGVATTYGNPDWARVHGTAKATAPAVLTLLEAGARMVGKTKTVELAYGLTGENPWHGTPINPLAADRYPGGSSCGSAAAVASGQVAFALGSDTGGSVRIPASYCGLFGIRPTHGAVSLAGACALAPSFDTAGWFSRTAGLLVRVGDVLLPSGPRLGAPWLRVTEAWENAEPAVVAALTAPFARLQQTFGTALDVNLIPEGPAAVHEHFRALQAQEVWATLGDFVASVNPKMSPPVAARFAAARALDPNRAAAGRAFRMAFQARVRPLLEGGAVLVYPTSPCPAPLLTASQETLEAVRATTLGVTGIAGLCGLPEVTLPLGQVRLDDGRTAPVGLSLVGAGGRDRALLALAQEAAAVLGLP